MRNIPYISPTTTLAELSVLLIGLGASLRVREVGARVAGTRAFEASVSGADAAASAIASTIPEAIRLALCDFARDM